MPALQSIFAQTFGDWELLAIDDGSTDRTLAILSSIDAPPRKATARQAPTPVCVLVPFGTLNYDEASSDIEKEAE